MRGHIWFTEVSLVHPGQMVNEIKFKVLLILFYKDLKGLRSLSSM